MHSGPSRLSARFNPPLLRSSWARQLDLSETCPRHWTIWGISLQALAFFLARAIQGGSSWGSAGAGEPRWAGFSGAVLDEKGGEVTVMLWGWGLLGEVAVLEGGGGLVQEGDFWGTGTGVGGDRDLWSGIGWGVGLVAAGGTWGFGGTGQGSDWGLGGWGGTGAGGERALRTSFSTDTGGLLISSGLTGGRRIESVKKTKQGKHFLKDMFDCCVCWFYFIIIGRNDSSVII